MSFDLWSLVYIGLGLVSGFLAGLLGVGGGAVMVPVLAMCFTALNFPFEHILHMSLATAMATIIFTAMSSIRAHQAHGAVDWRIVKFVSPGVILGAFLGTMIVAQISTRGLAIFFGVFIAIVALQMAMNFRPPPSHRLPGGLGIASIGVGIGGLSAMVAIGGGSLTVPWLTWCNVPIKRAIGTSAAMGLPIAVFGTLGYLWNGVGVAGLPTGSWGYLYLPALVFLAIASMITAPYGARAAQRLPMATLKRIFAVLLLSLSAKMLWSVWGG